MEFLGFKKKYYIYFIFNLKLEILQGFPDKYQHHTLPLSVPLAMSIFTSLHVQCCFFLDLLVLLGYFLLIDFSLYFSIPFSILCIFFLCFPILLHFEFFSFTPELTGLFSLISEAFRSFPLLSVLVFSPLS